MKMMGAMINSHSSRICSNEGSGCEERGIISTFPNRLTSQGLPDDLTFLTWVFFSSISMRSTTSSNGEADGTFLRREAWASKSAPEARGALLLAIVAASIALSRYLKLFV